MPWVEDDEQHVMELLKGAYDRGLNTWYVVGNTSVERGKLFLSPNAVQRVFGFRILYIDLMFALCYPLLTMLFKGHSQCVLRWSQ
jgi:hypothetical protein